ncbi:MAG: phosphatase PAP2 family protein [Candidatus Vogelbacteria bacterium]|nr:phosphatase PAP2 family protein [Candidatus Vogelbacteria bacterium]
MPDWILTIDKSVQQYVLSTHPEASIKFWESVTFLANTTTILTLFILIFLAFAYKKNWLRALELLIVSVGTEATVFILKIIVDRDRPIGALVNEMDPAFPSGHSAAAMMFFGFVFFALTDNIKNYWNRFGLRMLGVIFIVLIPISRVELNVHFASDIFAGILIGGIWLYIGEKLFNFLMRAEPAVESVEKEP